MGPRRDLDVRSRLERSHRRAPTLLPTLHGTLTAFYIREYAWAAARLAQGNDRPEIREQAADYLARM